MTQSMFCVTEHALAHTQEYESYTFKMQHSALVGHPSEAAAAAAILSPNAVVVLSTDSIGQVDEHHQC